MCELSVLLEKLNIATILLEMKENSYNKYVL